MVRKLFICLLLLFCFNSNVFAYSYQGFELPATSGVDDTFYGVETVKNILDGLSISYDDSSLPGYTYQINEAMKILSEKYDFLTARNVCFIKDVNSSLYLDPSNGTFSNDLYYLRLGEWYGNYRIYHIEDINSPFSHLNFTDTYLITNTSYSRYSSNNYITIPGVTFSDDVVNSSAIIAPIATFSVAGATPSAPSVYSWYFLSNTFDFTKVEDPPSESGDTGGNVDLSGIQTGINNINNNLNNIENKIPSSGDIKETISGEVGKVTETLTTVPDLSGEVITKQEIDDALSLDFMADPYDNFWYELTTGLSHALTDNIRQYDIPWINGYVYTFNLDTWGLKFPPAIEFVLRSMSVIAITWVIVKYWKIIVDKISSGSIDEVLAMNEEEGIIDLF